MEQKIKEGEGEREREMRKKVERRRGWTNG